MKSMKEIQARLVELGYDIGPHGVDGKGGRDTKTAIMQFQRDHGLQVDGIAGPRTQSSLWPFGEAPPTEAVSAEFDSTSAKNLAEAHLLLQHLLNAARGRIAFQVLDARRGKAAQELAFKLGHSKAHYGQSPHNYTPAIACDITPLPVNGKIPWDDRDAFKDLWLVIGWFNPKNNQGSGLALEMRIPIRWGGDWGMDGSHEKGSGWDMPHYELHEWRDWSKKNGTKLYRGK